MTKLATLLLALALAACAAPTGSATKDCKTANPANASYGDGC